MSHNATASSSTASVRWYAAPYTAFVSSQNSTSLPFWSPVQRIVFTTGSIPVDTQVIQPLNIYNIAEYARTISNDVTYVIGNTLIVFPNPIAFGRSNAKIGSLILGLGIPNGSYIVSFNGNPLNPGIIISVNVTQTFIGNGSITIIDTTSTIGGSSINVNQYKPVLIDFEPLHGIDDFSPYQYYPQGPWKFNDMIGGGELRTINLQTYWIDTKGVYNLIQIPPNDKLSVQLAFVNKSLIKF